MEYKNCKIARYHEMVIVASPYRGDITTRQKERCSKCGQDFAYDFTPDGQMKDSHQYFLDHIRYFAQPIEEDEGMMAAFLFCNPKAAKRFEEASKADKKHEWFQQEMQDKFRWAIKKALNNEGWKDKGDFDGIDRSVKD